MPGSPSELTSTAVDAGGSLVTTTDPPEVPETTDVGEVYAELDDRVETGSRLLEHSPNVLERLPGLCFEVALANHLPVGGERRVDLVSFHALPPPPPRIGASDSALGGSTRTPEEA